MTPRGMIQTEIEAPLFHAYGEDVFALDFKLDAEGRAEVGALGDGAADPDVARKIGHFGGIEEGVAAGIADHGVFGGAKTVLGGESIEVGNIFELTISVGGAHGESPVAFGLRGGAARKAHDDGRNIFTGEAVAEEKIFGSPGLGHLGDGGDLRIGVGGVGEKRVGIGGGGGNFELRRGFGYGWIDVFRAHDPAGAEEQDNQDREQSTYQAERGGVTTGTPRGGAGDSRNLRHLCFETVW
jgi:hypothetical protein